jgi:hypothetical protein
MTELQASRKSPSAQVTTRQHVLQQVWAACGCQLASHMEFCHHLRPNLGGFSRKPLFSSSYGSYGQASPLSSALTFLILSFLPVCSIFHELCRPALSRALSFDTLKALLVQIRTLAFYFHYFWSGMVEPSPCLCICFPGKPSCNFPQNRWSALGVPKKSLVVHRSTLTYVTAQ